MKSLRHALLIMAIFEGGALASCALPATRLAVSLEPQSALTAVRSSAALSDLITAFEAYERAADPYAAGRAGDRAAARRLPDVSAKALAARTVQRQEFLSRAKSIASETLTGADRLNHALLIWTLERRIDEAAFGQERIPFSSDSGFFTLGSFLPRAQRFASLGDFENYLARLEDMPRFFADHIANMRQGMAQGYVAPRASSDAIADQLRANIAADPTQSAFYAPFASPGAIGADPRFAALERRARSVISGVVNLAYRDLLAFWERDYFPATRATLAARDLPDGETLYRALVREHTTLDLTPEEVHAIGKSEVARIRAEMEEVKAQAGFTGDLQDFIAFLRTDPQFYAKTPEELLGHASRIAKRIDRAMPRLFGKLPRLSYGVEPVPADIAPGYTTGRYIQGDIATGRAGEYWVNTHALDQRPLYELPALTLHEGVPGHHHQIALAQELENVPEFRREIYPTAFGEGWGLYSERLGLDVGIYQTPYEQFGRLSYEMWRACRLVADTGIHWYRWTIDQAEQCFRENSALSPLNIEREVKRYVSWPGQALAYKIGELEFRRLRNEAETALGAKFDLRAFHDSLLAEGGLPLPLVRAQIEAWIAAQAKAGS